MSHLQSWWRSIASLKGALADHVFGTCCRMVLDGGKWRDPLVESFAPLPDERILVLSGNGGKLGPALAKLHPATRFAVVDWDCVRASNSSMSDENTDVLQCDDYRITCQGGIFDKAIISWALHRLQDEQKVRLLREMRRILRRGGVLHVVDYDRPEGLLEHAGLAYASRQCGYEAIRTHLDGTWVDTIRMADFTDVRRLSSHHELTVHASIVRARRRL